MDHAEIRFPHSPCEKNNNFTNLRIFLKICGNLSMTIAYTNSYRNTEFQSWPAFSRQHKKTYLRGWQMRWFFVLGSILPQVFKFWTSTHCRTRRFGALFTNSSINQIDSEMKKRIKYFQLTKTCPHLSTSSRKPGNINGTVIFVIHNMKNPPPIN